MIWRFQRACMRKFQPADALRKAPKEQENWCERDLAVFRFEYLQGIKQEFWFLLADAVTDPGKAPFADVRNQRHGP